jgi:pimeloyl-ACP methyl ester carboxylesterase
MGYVANKNLFAANYDWRVSPGNCAINFIKISDFLENYTSYLHDFVTLIENTFNGNGGNKVILVAHSMGNLNLLRLLNQQSQDWKDK